MIKKHQIFISSTFVDLQKTREKVRNAILTLGHYPAGMEMFGARTAEQWKIIEDEINKSDFYIVIIGRRFGSIVPGEDISYTQKEFRYALKKGIPILGFIASKDAELEKEETETDNYDKLQHFINEVESGRTVSYWRNPDNLATQVVCSIVKEIYDEPRMPKDYGEGISLRDGWNFHSDIALELEMKARHIYGDYERPYDKTYDADGIESGGYFAEVMIDLLREKSGRTNNREDIDEFITDLAPFIHKTGYEIPNTTAQGLVNRFYELITDYE